MEVDSDLTAAQLDVYDSKEGGVWHPDHGALTEPEGWEFLPAGDSFLTRRVKAAGVYWLLWRPRDRYRRHRRLLGVLAPAETISRARAEAAETSARRSSHRAQAATYRGKREDAYRRELAAAIVAYLDFAPEHADLAQSIAAQATERASEVGSGRVGRAQKLTVDQRAALAARAWIRHKFTHYQDRLETDVSDDDFLYRSVKSDAHAEVDRYLEGHRRRTES